MKAAGNRTGVLHNFGTTQRLLISGELTLINSFANKNQQINAFLSFCQPNNRPLKLINSLSSLSFIIILFPEVSIINDMTISMNNLAIEFVQNEFSVHC